jgi:glucose/arabinose dehydrogenase/cytochrome c553
VANRIALVTAATLAGFTAAPALAQGVPRGCDPNNGGITLSPGFCAGIFADNIGHARHMAVAPDGTVFVNTWSGRYFDNDTPPRGGFIVALKDTKGTGKADSIQRFGQPSEAGAAGGTGIALYNDALYVEEQDRILRYALANGMPNGAPTVIVSGLPITGDHPMHPFLIDPKGNLYVDLGSITNDCQVEDRHANSPGHMPCTELETRAGTWKYDANKTGQRFSPADRYATGIRNGEGFAMDSAGRLYVTQHGRDQLSQLWPALFTNAQSAELPAEEVVQLEAGGDYGWPQCYYDQLQKTLILAPEYGGDGKTVGLCAQKKPPAAAFPGHWAPNDLLIYQGSQFPAPYREGMYIAFHGSWNRAPLPQQGFSVVYQPLKDGKADGDYVVFADGFAGGNMKDRATAAFRPSGLAMAPDGALYIADDNHGRIWRVVFSGNPATTTKIAPAPQPSVVAANATGGRPDVSTLPIPPGSSREQIALGDRIFHGEEKGAACAGCHGPAGQGTPGGSSLISGKWLWGSGSLAAIKHTITVGVPKPKLDTGLMPAKGGAQLSDADVAAVAAYVWAIGHATPPKQAKAAP